MRGIKPVRAVEVPARPQKSNYPEPYASLMTGRLKRKLGDFFDLKNFGVNLTELSPGSMSALKHQHSQQDEFVYILSGTPTLVYGSHEDVLGPGECVGFKAGEGSAHHRTSGDGVVYPDDDICAKSEADGTWTFTHKDGRPYYNGRPTGGGPLFFYSSMTVEKISRDPQQSLPFLAKRPDFHVERPARAVLMGDVVGRIGNS